MCFFFLLGVKVKFTYDDVLEELNLNRYDEITLDELDERIIKVID